MKSLIPSDEKLTLGLLGGFSPVLSCIRSITDSGDINFTEIKTPPLEQSSFRFLKNETCVKNGNGFCMAISLTDGNTLFVTNTITEILGYPRDMLIGQCIMNYLYPRDRVTFANQLTQGLQSCFTDSDKESLNNQTESVFFCRIREYHRLSNGFGISDKKTRYKPFQVTIRLRDLALDEPCVEESSQSMCLIATFVPVVSAYKASEEIPAMSYFSTRHTASCHFSYVDSSSIAYLGFLPQDILGFSIFDFYHMDDMPQLKDIYELVVKEQGRSFRSKPYRFKTFNGTYVILETEWSSFINPWSRKLEFVVGQHRVLKGPVEPNVFSDSLKDDCVVSDEILKESQRIQKEIRNILSQPVKSHVNCDGIGRRCHKRRRGIASFVSSLVEDMCQGRGENEEQRGLKEECSCSDHSSVVMGEISPHQEFNDSDPSSVTPPTSEEIRYQENIDRFFASQPTIYSSDGSAVTESKTNSLQKYSMSVDNESGKTSGDSGNGSLSRSGGGSTVNYPFVSLTEETLSQHNRIAHKYTKQRKVKIVGTTNIQPRKELHRLKRSSSPTQHNKSNKLRTSNQTQPMKEGMQNNQSTMPGFNVNPPFSLRSFPDIPHTSVTTNWNNSVTSSSYTSPMFNSQVPNYGMPSYNYLSGAASGGGAPSPFFMPVMYVGAMPFYPSIPPMMPHSSPTMWPYNPGMTCAGPNGGTNTNTSFNLETNQQQQHIMRPTATSSVMVQTTNSATKSQPNSDNHGTSASSFSSKGVFEVIPETDLKRLKNESSQMEKNSVTSPCRTELIIGTESVAIKRKKSSGQTTIQKTIQQVKEQDDCASLSSSYLLKSDVSSQSASDRAEEMEMETTKGTAKHPILKDPPWMDGVQMNHDLIFLYKIPNRDMDEVLKKDMEALKSLKQPKQVGKQLAQLKKELAEEENDTRDSRDTFLTASSHCKESPLSSVNLGFSTLEEDADQNKEDSILLIIEGDII